MNDDSINPGTLLGKQNAFPRVAVSNCVSTGKGPLIQNSRTPLTAFSPCQRTCIGSGESPGPDATGTHSTQETRAQIQVPTLLSCARPPLDALDVSTVMARAGGVRELLREGHLSKQTAQERRTSELRTQTGTTPLGTCTPVSAGYPHFRATSSCLMFL